jgi:hypothetical protein
VLKGHQLTSNLQIDGNITCGLGDGDSALGLGDGDGGARARGRGRRRSGSGTGTAALRLEDGDGGALGARARGRGRRRSGSGMGSARQPGGATVSAREGRVRVPAGTKAFYIVNNHRRILRKTACDI